MTVLRESINFIVGSDGVVVDNKPFNKMGKGSHYASNVVRKNHQNMLLKHASNGDFGMLLNTFGLDSTTVSNYEYVLRNFCSYLLDYKAIRMCSLNKVTADDMRDYVEYLLDKGVRAVTVDSYVYAIRKVYKSMEIRMPEKGWVDITEGIGRFAVSNEFTKEGITKEQWEGILSNMPEDNHIQRRSKLLVYFLFITGQRSMSLRGLKWCDFVVIPKSNALMIDVRLKGTDRRHQIPLPEKAILLLKDYKDSYIAKYCIDRNGKEHEFNDNWYIFGSMDKEKSSDSVRHIVTKELKKAGLYRKYEVTTHSFRHGAASHILEKSGDKQLTQHLLGHSNPSTTDIYVRRAAKNMNNNKLKGILDDIVNL